MNIAKIDLRALGLFRICLAAIILVDLWLRSSDITGLYSDFGAIPRSLIGQESGGLFVPSMYMLSGSGWFVGLLFFLQAAMAVVLLVGYRTKLVLGFSWFLLLSLHARTPHVLQGGDQLLLLYLFWSMFLPLGARFSVDSISGSACSSESKKHSISSAASLAILLQICFVYWFTVFHKSAPEWRETFTAVQLALSNQSFATPLGYSFSSFEQAGYVLTVFTLGVELLAPLLFFIPVYTSLCRKLGVLLLFLLHLGIFLFLDVGLFPFISVAGLLLFLPKDIFDSLEQFKLTSSLAKVVSPKFSPGDSRFSEELGPRSLVFVRDALVYLVLLFVLLLNIESLPEQQGILPKKVFRVAQVLRLQQHWSMFSPSPPRFQRWYRFIGSLEDGTQVDLLTEGKVPFGVRPISLRSIFPNNRWRKYLRNTIRKKQLRRQRFLGAYYCRKWNTQYEDRKRLRQVSFRYVENQLMPKGVSYQATERRLETVDCE